MAGENPSALVRLWEEFDKVEPDARLNGIYTGKRGYHNTRNNHLAGRNGGSPSDYSITDSPLDLLGPGDKAAAIDINMESARLRSDFRTMDKYCSRLLTACQNRDARLFHDGKPVIREFFGNTDLDREVEGWSLFRGRAATSDSTHLWHIHISFHRWCVENWAAVAGVLAVLADIGQPEPIPEDEVELTDLVRLPQWFIDRYPNDSGIADGTVQVQTAMVSGYTHSKVAREEIKALDAYVHDAYNDLLANMKQTQAMITSLTTRLEALHPAEPDPEPQPATYTVVAGDTLSGIAQRFGTTVDILVSLNNIPDPSKLSIGQVLILP